MKKWMSWTLKGLAGAGAVNWLLIGLAQMNVVEQVFGVGVFTKIIYVGAGASTLWLLFGKK